MPAGSRHPQATPSLTLEFATTPTDSLHKPFSELIFHLTWPLLDPPSIMILCVATSVISCYGKIHNESISLTAAEIHRILTPLDHITSTYYTCSLWARDIAKLLILCNFRLGGMICFLVGIYTSNFLDFVSKYVCTLALSVIPVNSGKPPHKLYALQHLFHQHIPYKATFQSARRYILFRNCYNNHNASDPYLSSIYEKSATNIQ